MIVCGTVRDATGTLRYLDELSPLGPTFLAEFYQENAFSSSKLPPEAFPMQPATLADLRGANPRTNAEIILRIFEGKDRGPRRDAVLLNAAAALFLAGKARALTEGWEAAARVIDEGAALRKLTDLRGEGC